MMEQTKEKEDNVLLKFLFFSCVILIHYIVWGYVFSKLWGWFIVTHFNAPYLRPIDAIGVLLVAGIVGFSNNLSDFFKTLRKSFDDFSELSWSIIIVLIKMVFLMFYLAMGYFWRSFL